MDLLFLWDSVLDSLWDLLWDSSGIHETCVGPHVTRDTHVGLVARGWLDSLVFSLVFNLACSSTQIIFTMINSGVLIILVVEWLGQILIQVRYRESSNSPEKALTIKSFRTRR